MYFEIHDFKMLSIFYQLIYNEILRMSYLKYNLDSKCKDLFFSLVNILQLSLI